MRQQDQPAMVDELAELAAHAEPPALDDTAARRMIEQAAAGAPRAHLAPTRRPVARSLVAAFAGACLAAAAMYLWLGRRVTPVEPALARVTLPTGDRLALTAGAQYDIVELAPASRRLRVTSGEVVFDVAHVVHDQHFEVAVPHATVIATGTVFSVATDGTATRVHVFEGSVVIAHDGQRDPLAAGTTWSSATSTTSDAITAAGEAFARERTTTAVQAKPPAAAASEKPPTPSSMPTTAKAPPEPERPSSAPAPTRAPQPVIAKIESVGAEPAPDVQPVTIANARSAIAAGEYEDALLLAGASWRQGESGPWELVRGDALRALGRTDEAATAYEAATAALVGPAKLEAAYEAAYLRLRDLKQADRALADLDGIDAQGSPFEERALVLRVSALTTLGRKNEAAVIAARYLDRFPQGSSAKLMQQLAH